MTASAWLLIAAGLLVLAGYGLACLRERSARLAAEVEALLDQPDPLDATARTALAALTPDAITDPDDPTGLAPAVMADIAALPGLPITTEE